MRYLLDTDTFSVIARSGNPLLLLRLAQIPLGDIALSAITVGEIEFGIANKRPRAASMKRIEHYRSALRVVDVDKNVAHRYGVLRSELRAIGTPIGPNDLWIAAQALAHDLTLVTGNEREFARVPTLRVENWMR